MKANAEAAASDGRTGDDKIIWSNAEIYAPAFLSREIHLARGMEPLRQIRRNGPIERALKSRILSPYRMLTDAVRDSGYIEAFAAAEIRRYWRQGAVFLDVACGAMALARCLPADAWYNAFDYRLNDAFLDNLFRRREKANVALADVADIPVAPASVDIITCLQAFMHFPDFDKAAAELARIAKPGAKLICTIGNFHASLYTARGPHSEETRRWRFDVFVADMARHGFVPLHGDRRGRWVPLPFVTKRAYTLNVRSRREEDNLTFLYVFERSGEGGVAR
jgi:SAM-dependent methyltransferase